MKDSQKQIIFLAIGIGLVGVVGSYAILRSTVRKTEYTVEVYEIFEVNWANNYTYVYTYGQTQFFFRGDHPINESRSYSFTYVENGKRWRDLTLLDYHEIRVLSREDVG